jgi:CHAT domain-containing protein/Tfp pilus assembly protein PilF
MPQSRKRVALFAVFLTASLCVSPLLAQQSRWEELNDQSSQLYEQGKYAEATPIAAEAVKVAEAAFGADDTRLATALNRLARLYYIQGKYADAEPLYKRALSIREKALGPDQPEVAQTLHELGDLYLDQNRYAEAERLYERALPIDLKAFGPDDAGVAVDLNDIALTCDHQGKYAEAEPLYRRALGIVEKALGPEQREVATYLNNLAALYDDEGRYADAEPLYQRALHISEKALGPDHPGVAIALSNLALLYRHLGKYGEAEPLYRRALSIDEKALGPDDPDVAKGLNGLALLYKDQGRYAEAEPLAQRALRIVEKALGPDNRDVGADVNNLAMLYTYLGQYAQAEPLFRRALRIAEQALGPDAPEVASTLGNIALVCTKEGRDAEAEPLYKRALNIAEKTLGPGNPGVATPLDNLARHYDRLGKYDEAEPLYRRALEIQEKALGPEHPDLVNSLGDLASHYDDQDKFAEAEPFYQRTFENLFQQFQYSFTYMTERERLGFLDMFSPSFPIYFSFVHRYREKDPELIGSMYNLLLWEKGFIAGSVADMRARVEASGDAEALKLLGQLTAKRTQIAALLNVTPPDRDQWRKQIDQLKSEADEIEKALVARSSAFAERKKLDRATWQQVRDAIGPGEAAVEFAHFRNYEKGEWTHTSYYAALVVTRESKDQPEYIFLGDDKQIEGDALTRFQQSVQARGLSAEPQAELPGADAYGLIWKPLERALAGKTRIYLSTDGILNEIPLGIIPAPGGKLLMERYDLRLLSSTKDILRSVPPRSAAAALLIGDPDFDMNEQQQLAAVLKLALPQQEAPVHMAALSPDDRSRDLGDGSTLPRLPGTGAEVAAVANLMQQQHWKTSVYINQLALKTVVEQASSPRVVHLATHGFFLPDQQIKADATGPGESQPSGLEDPMLRSGLFFAGADRTLAGKPSAEGLDNGVLTAMEAGNLNLRGTELVVLSACNTGQGDVKNGEGVFGLRRALEEAGAQSILMSLWSVPDRETLELMKRFYTKWLAGMEIHKALKEAQLEMREKVKKDHDGKDLPYYWGAFVLVGR